MVQEGKTYYVQMFFLLLQLFLPFSFSRIVLLISWYIFLNLIYFWASRNIFVHFIRLYAEYTTTNSTPCWFLSSVFDFVTFILLLILPLLMLLLYKILNPIIYRVLYALNARHNFTITTRYFMSLSSLFQSPWLVYLTIVHKTSTVVWMSSFAIFNKNKPISTVVWNNSALFLFGGLLPSTLTMFSVVDLVTAWYLLIFIRN